MTTDVWNYVGYWNGPYGNTQFWSLNAAPTASQDAMITSGTAPTLISAGQAANITILPYGDLYVVSGASLSASGLTNFGSFVIGALGYGGEQSVDASGHPLSAGGENVTVSGTLANYGTLTLGNSSLATSTNLTVNQLANLGTINLTGNQAVGATQQATLDVKGAAPPTLTGTTYLRGDALLQFASGGVTSIGTGGFLDIAGQQARVAIGAGTDNSALTGLTTNFGTLDLEGGTSGSPGGVTLSTTSNLLNGGAIDLDINGYEGGSQMTVGGTLTNTGAIIVGNSELVGSSTLNVGNLVNQGSINLWGNNNLNTSAQATLNVQSGAPATWTGSIYIHGDSDVIFASGGITSLAAGSLMQIDGKLARYSIGADTTNSALNGLASNYGRFDEEGDWSTGPGGATVTTTALFTNYDNFQLDVYGNDGASTFTDTMLFTNQDSVQVGNDQLSANTTLAVAGLANNGTLYIDSQRNAGSNPLSAVMVSSAAPSTSTGDLRLTGNSLLHYLSGSITSIAAGASIELDGNAASIASGSGGQNSGLAQLSSNAGTLLLRGSNGYGSGVTLTTGAYASSGYTRVDYFGNDGGSAWTLTGALGNSGELDIGNTELPAGVTVNATAFNNTGSFTLQGAYSASSSPIAALNISGAASASVGSFQRIGGSAVLTYGSGAGYTAIASTGELELDGQGANVRIGSSGAQNSGLASLRTNLGTLLLRGGSGYGAGGAAVSLGAPLYNGGLLYVDYYGGDGGSTLSIAGTLTNAKTVDIGNTSLSAATTVSATNLNNTGALTVQGGYALNAPAATFNVTAAATTNVNGSVRVGGAANLNFGSGTGFAGIATAATLELDGAQANVAITGGAANSALANLAYNEGTLLLRGDSGYGQGGVTLKTSTNFLNLSNTDIDYYGSDGGSTVTFGGTLSNSNSMYIGNTSLSAATTVNATTLNNTGTLTLQGNYYTSSARATLALTGASPTTLSNSLRIGGTATVSFGSGVGYKAIAAGGSLELDGAQAQVVVGSGGPTSGISGLVTNSGTLLLRGNSGYGQGGVTIATTGNYYNLGTTEIDYYGSDSASSFSVNGALSNQGSFTLGNGGDSVASQVSAKSLSNLTGQVSVFGGSATSTISVSGAVSNDATVYVGTGGAISATGAFTQAAGATTILGTLSSAGYTQASGTTTVSGTLASTTVNDRGGSISYNSALTASSQTTTLNLETGGALQFHAGVSSSQTVNFQDATGTLDLYAPTAYSGNVTGFTAGDVIDLIQQSSASSVSYAGGVLSVLDSSSNVLEAFKVSGGAYTSSSFTLVGDSNFGKYLLV